MPQGTLAERLRAAGAGIGGFFVRAGVGTMLQADKETRDIDGSTYMLEQPLRGDTLLEAWEADRWGNLTYRGAGQNFNPVMATAATVSVAQVQRVVELGAIDPATSLRPPSSSIASSPSPMSRPTRPSPFEHENPMSAPADRNITPQADDRRGIASRIAREIEEGWNVNLGIGIPTLVADLMPPDREVLFHSENGILGMGPVPPAEQIDPWLVNAGKQNVTLLPGASLFDHALSFTMIRGGHIDLAILGTYEVAESGDLANWATSAQDAAPAVGGAPWILPWAPGASGSPWSTRPKAAPASSCDRAATR